jgi:signal peptidase II
MKKHHLFWPLALGLLVADRLTKWMAEQSLQLHRPTEVLGELVRFTLAYNPGAAFGIDVGPASRWVFITLTLVALGALYGMYRTTPPGHRIQLTALALISGGALGNLVDRVRGPAGVVDFIDVGLGGARFWTFNLADAGITVGAILLALSLWAEPEPAAEPEPESDPGPTAAPAPERAGEDGGAT